MKTPKQLRIISAAIMICFTTLPGFSQSWHALGGSYLLGSQHIINGTTENFGIRPLVIAPDGTPYLAFHPNPLGHRKATVIRFNGSSWDTVGIPEFSESVADYISMAIDRNNTPYVVFQDGAYSYEPTVMKFTAGSWQLVGNPGFAPDAPHFNQAVDYSDIAIDKNGTPYIGYANAFNGNKAVVMKYDGNNWVAVGGSSVSDGAAYYLSLAIDSMGAPYIAYQDRAHDEKASVMKYDGSSWVSVDSIGFSSDSVRYTSIAFDKNDIPYLAYSDGNDSNKATVVKYNGTDWVTVGNAGLSAGETQYEHIAIDKNGIPYVVYWDLGVPYYAIKAEKYNGTEWVNVGNGIVSGGAAPDPVNQGGSYPSIAIDNEGTPYIAYFVPLPVNILWGGKVKRYGLPGTGISTTNTSPLHHLSISPNPNNGNFTIEGLLPSNIRDIDLRVIDVSGKIIWEENIEAKKGKVNIPINLNQGIACGIYFIKLHSGTYNESLPIVKQ